MDHFFLKSLLNFLTILLLFFVLVFWQRSMWDHSSPTRDQTCTPELEGEVLTTEQPGKSISPFFWSPAALHGNLSRQECQDRVGREATCRRAEVPQHRPEMGGSWTFQPS